MVKHGTGNIYLGGSDLSLDDTEKALLLYYDGTNWLAVGSGGGGGGGATALDDLTDVDTGGKLHGDVITWDQSEGEWQPEAPVRMLLDLDNVFNSYPINGQVMQCRKVGLSVTYNFRDVEEGYGPEGYRGGNLVKNFPSLEFADGNPPQWWDLDGSAFFVEEDISGIEGAPHARGLRWNGYGSSSKIYQPIDAEHEPLLEYMTSISIGVWVYQGSSDNGTIMLDYGREDSGWEDMGMASTYYTDEWVLLKIEDVMIPSDTTGLRFRLYMDNLSGTFYATLPVLNVGRRLRPWQPRRLRLFEPPNGGTVLSAADPPDTNWHDVSLPSTPADLARAVRAQLLVEYENQGAAGHTISLRRKGRFTSTNETMVVRNHDTSTAWLARTEIMVDDTGTFQYKSTGGANTEVLSIYYDSAWIWE
jgi:hypothetical protein